MNVLDTDALSHHMKSNAIGQAIGAHIAASEPDFKITAVSAFEMVDGALELYERLKKKPGADPRLQPDPGSGRIFGRLAGKGIGLWRRRGPDIP